MTRSRSLAETSPSAGRALFALATIPVGAVTGAALLADAASSTEPSAPVAGGFALAAGLVMGLLVRQLFTSVCRGVRAAQAWVQRMPRPAFTTVAPAAGWMPFFELPAMVPERVESGVGRRGPPAFVR